MTTKTYIICGPLGSGKTTTLNEILSSVPKSLKVGIVINDAGYIGTDSQRILPGYETGSIPGCICCESSGNLSFLLKQIKGKYDLVFIEGTGGANAANLVEEVLRHSQHYAVSGVIAVVPVDHFQEVSQTVSFNTAVDMANIIRLTWQSDEIDSTLNERLAGKKLFEKELTYKDIKEGIWVFDVSGSNEHEDHSDHHHEHTDHGGHHHGHSDHDHHHHSPHDNLKASVIPIARTVTSEQMMEPLNYLAKEGVERAKGFLPDGRTFDIVHGEISVRESTSGGLPYVMIISSKGKIDTKLLERFDTIKAPALQPSKFFNSNISFDNACRTFDYAHRKAKAEHYVQRGSKISTEFEGADTAFMMGYEILHYFKDAKYLTIAMDDYVRIRLEGIKSISQNMRLYQRNYMGATLASYAVLTVAIEKYGAYPYQDKNAIYLGKYVSDETRKLIISEAIPAFVQFISQFSDEDFKKTVKEGTDGYFADVAHVAMEHADQDTKVKFANVAKKIADSYTQLGVKNVANQWQEIGDIGH